MIPGRSVHVEMGRKWVGGAAQVLYLVEGLRRRGYDARLLCASSSEVGRRAEAQGIPVSRVPDAADADPRLFLALWSAIRELRPEVVHLHSRRGADTWGMAAARAARVPAVVLSRRIANPPWPGLLTRLKYGPLCDRVIAISRGIEKVLLDAGVPPAKVVCVRSGVNAAAFRREPCREWLGEVLELPSQGARIGVIAQLVEQKGHRVVLDAAPAVLARHPLTKFLFFGEGAGRQRLEQEAGSRGLRNSVVFAGFTSDVARVLAGIDILAHPAFLEGLGVAVLEALAAGKPVVATAVGGLPESVRPEETGLLIPPRDPQALAQALLRYLDDPEFARRMGERGAALVASEFTVDAMVEGNLRVYESVLGTCRTPAPV